MKANENISIILKVIESSKTKFKHQDIIDSFRKKGFAIINDKKYLLKDVGHLTIEELLNIDQ